jgi:hypothetical protein
MILHCPLCEKRVNTSDFQVLPDTRGGFNCPECGKLLHYYQPYPLLRRTVSLLIPLAILAFLGVRSLPILAIGSLLLWAPMQLLVNTYCATRLPLGLKPWKSGRQNSLELFNRQQD